MQRFSMHSGPAAVGVDRECDYETVFRFASPANQILTGPITRFAAMLHSPIYAPLLRHAYAEALVTTQTSAASAEIVVGNPTLPMALRTNPLRQFKTAHAVQVGFHRR